MTLYFFELITESDFIGPVVIAAENEDEAWRELARRERGTVDRVREVGWHVAQELAELPARRGVVYPSHYRRAIV